jgi:2-polyprenyl-6-methoxyphenol hydroxylase-like FAD-dependent oxidoreductase
LTAQLRITVIGGGLAAAVSLLRAGLEVDVYEQAAELNEVGGVATHIFADERFADAPAMADAFQTFLGGALKGSLVQSASTTLRAECPVIRKSESCRAFSITRPSCGKRLA